MKRRDILKAGLITAGALSVGLSGCSPERNNAFENLSIKPKQTAKYKIITPLPFNFDLIDKMYELNEKLKKSKVVDLYNNIPNPCSSFFDNNFQSQRGTNDKIKSVKDFMQYVKYAKTLGFEFTYVLNSPRAFTKNELDKYGKYLENLIETLINAECYNIKVANTQLFILLKEKYGTKLNLSASTSFEYQNIAQYQNLIKTNPEIKSINLATDVNKNFKLLKNLRKAIPNVDLEIMVNENCIHGCSGRISHPQSSIYIWQCFSIRKKMGEIPFLLITNVVYPWDLEYYSALGINSFKLVSYPFRANMTDIEYLRNYLYCVENGIDDMPARQFFEEVFRLDNEIKLKKDIKLSEIRPYFPDIRYFVKNGEHCANICQVDCKYCFECAEKIKKIIF